jgi:RNA polymerase sigma factor (sigma-70 family)
MRLAKRTIRGAEYRHPLFQYDLPPLTEDKIPDLLARLRTRDEGAKKEAVLGYVRLSMSIVGRYIAVLHSDRLANDLVGAAMEGIVVAIDRVANGEMKHDNLTAFVTTWVHKLISVELERRQVVKVPERTVQDRRKKNLEAPPRPVRVDLNDPTVQRKVSRPSSEDDIEIKEILDRVVQNDLQKSILELRQQGKTDQEIAAELDLSKTSVFVIRKEMETRFLEIFYA